MPEEPPPRRPGPAGEELLVDRRLRHADALAHPGAVDRAHPALASNAGTLRANDDGSHDLYCGPEAPDGREANWVETLPGKSRFVIFRLYGPLEPWFEKTWTLNEFEPLR